MIMQRVTDEEIIYKAFQKYPECCGSKKLPTLSQGKVLTLRANLLQQVEKYVLLMNSTKITETEKNTLCNKGKKLYQQYCFQMKVNPDIDTTRLSQKMDELLWHIATIEGKKALITRENQIAGNRIDLALLFEEEKNIRNLIGKPIDTVIKEALNNNKYTVVGEDVIAIYMTVSGEKYHRKSCQYCKGKNMIPTSLKKAENIGLTPCKCIATSPEIVREDKLPIDTMQESSELEMVQSEKTITRYMTAFIDESIAVNQWRDLDGSIPEKQGKYSYIICEGYLTEESQITDKNRIYSSVMPTQEKRSIGSIATEAILAVLFQLVVRGYHDSVVIYTNNVEAKDTWYKEPANEALAKLFASVIVCYVPRERNTKADKLARECTFVNLPTEAMKRILVKSKKYQEAKEELDFVKTFFPVPRKNIPNLIEELKVLDYIAKGGK